MDTAEPDRPGSPSRATRLLRRVAAWRSPPPRWRGAILLAALAVFVVGSVYSLRELDLRLAEVAWWPLVVVAVLGTPATIGINAAELRAMARCVDPRVAMPWREAVRVVVVATAANVLPLPGGALVRVQALRALGIGLGRATSTTLAAAVLWVAVAVMVAGLAGMRYAPVPAALATAIGLGAAAVGVGALRTTSVRWSSRAVGSLAGVEVATTVLHAAKLGLVLVALDVEVAMVQALVLGAAAPLAAAAGVFPSGLGLAELLSALLAPAVALSAASGFAAAALTRVVGLIGTAPVALVLGVRDLGTGDG